MRFTGTWYPFQLGILEAFELDRRRGSHRTNVVAPPGSGKTLLGLEMIRRLETPALVLVPNTAIQAQWIEEAEHFGDDLAGVTAQHLVTVVTYSSICRFEEDEELERAALRRLAKRGVTDPTPEQVTRARAAARLDSRRADDTLLSLRTQEVLDALTSKGQVTVVCDESHHAMAAWGYAVQAACKALGHHHRIGLTATRPHGSGEENELYSELFGPVDAEVVTPAIVREGRLSPYQELAWFTPLLEAERRWLADRDLRFTDVISRLHEDVDSPLSFPAWVIRRARDRADSRRLRQAMLRFLHSADLPVPRGTRATDEDRADPTMDDWGTLVDDWVRGCLVRSDDPRAAELLQEVRAALQPFGFAVSRAGARRSRSSVDRLLGASGARSVAMLDVLALELIARGDDIRALILCDSEQPGETTRDLTGVLDPWAGSAREALRMASDDVRLTALTPLLVSGKGIRCSPADADTVIAALNILAPEHGPFAAEDGQEDATVRIRGGATWVPRTWVAAGTQLLEQGTTKLVIGTRAMLGEGWDAPCLNVLVDRTMASTQTTSVQVRGRSLRLDPTQPEKVASNWDIVCVEGDLIGGDRDYQRFARKHGWLLAPAADGTIERGLSHVHASLSTATPPAAAVLDQLNTHASERSANREQARVLWRVGDGYAAREQLAAVIHLPEAAFAQKVTPTGWRGFLALLTRMLGPASDLEELREPFDLLPLERLARVHARALSACYVLPHGAEHRVVVEAREDGWFRCYLKDAADEESRAFVHGLLDVITPYQPEAPYFSDERAVPATLARAVWASPNARERANASDRSLKSIWCVLPHPAQQSEQPRLYAARWYDEFGTLAGPYLGNPGGSLDPMDPTQQTMRARTAALERWGREHVAHFDVRSYARTTWS